MKDTLKVQSTGVSDIGGETLLRTYMFILGNLPVSLYQKLLNFQQSLITESFLVLSNVSSKNYYQSLYMYQ